MKQASLIFLPVRIMLRQYIRYDIFACVFWLLNSIVYGTIVFLTADSLSRMFSGYNYIIYALSCALYMPFTFVIWASGLLINEFIWTLSGIYYIFHIKPNVIRDILFRLADISLKVEEDV